MKVKHPCSTLTRYHLLACGPKPRNATVIIGATRRRHPQASWLTCIIHIARRWIRHNIHLVQESLQNWRNLRRWTCWGHAHVRLLDQSLGQRPRPSFPIIIHWLAHYIHPPAHHIHLPVHHFHSLAHHSRYSRLRGQAMYKPRGRKPGHNSLPTCRACFLTISGMQSDVVPPVITYSTIVRRFRILVAGRVRVVNRQAANAADACFVAAGIRQILTDQCSFQCGYVGTYLAIFASCSTYLYDLQLENHKGAPKNVLGRAAEFRPRDNRHLIVHECSGSGPGELQAIRDFVTMYSHKNRPAAERLHAIW